jgi:hypothetical protein
VQNFQTINIHLSEIFRHFRQQGINSNILEKSQIRLKYLIDCQNHSDSKSSRYQPPEKNRIGTLLDPMRHMSEQPKLRKIPKCRVCRQRRSIFDSKQKSLLLEALLFGMEKYAICCLCYQRVRQPWTKFYRARFDRHLELVSQAS